MPTLNWIGREAVVNHDADVEYRLLHCDPERGVGGPGSGNLLVEGDNLLALKALLPYYADQVKCIYIDPPYNTGNESWIYNDNVNSPEIRGWLERTVGKEVEDLSRHDKWLCMMYPRLKLLRRFLSSDGAIFISIDDNEVAYLRALMDEIFGTCNFVATAIWQKNFSPKNSARHLSTDHDYVVIYAKNAEVWRPNFVPRSLTQDQRYKNPDKDPRGPWTSGDLSARNYYSLGTYSITCPSGRVIPGPPKGTYWRYSLEAFEALNRDHRIWWGASGNNVPRLKRFLSEVQDGVVPQTIWFHQDVGNTQEAKKELVAILSDAENVFTTPKPTRLIERILQLATDKDSLVMDSFAGTGTTGHAVLKQNAADGGNRRFILVEMDTTIARDITAQRLKNAVQGYGDVPGLGGAFRYCALGDPLFQANGSIGATVTWESLARHLYFTETGEPLSGGAEAPLVGCSRGTAYYLLWDAQEGPSLLDSAALNTLPPHDGPRVVYADGCSIGAARLSAENILFKQIPYEVRTI